MAFSHISLHFSKSPFSKYTAEQTIQQQSTHDSACHFKANTNQTHSKKTEGLKMEYTLFKGFPSCENMYLLGWICKSCWWGHAWLLLHNVSTLFQSPYSYMQSSQVPFPSRPVKKIIMVDMVIKKNIRGINQTGQNILKSDLPVFYFLEDLPLWEEVAGSLWVWEEEEEWALLLPSQRGSVPTARRVWSSLWDPAASCKTGRCITNTTACLHALELNYLILYSPALENEQHLKKTKMNIRAKLWWFVPELLQ